MRALVLSAAALLLPLVAFAEDMSEGEKIFNAKCSACHTFTMAQGMLAPIPDARRPAHLTEFLKTHPPLLNESEKKAVIAALSRAGR